MTIEGFLSGLPKATRLRINDGVASQAYGSRVLVLLAIAFGTLMITGTVMAGVVGWLIGLALSWWLYVIVLRNIEHASIRHYLSRHPHGIAFARCPRCKYSQSGISSSRCPECGCPVRLAGAA